MQGDTCTKNAIDLKHLVMIAFEISEKEVHEIHKLISKLATCSEYQFEMIEADLNKHHTSEKVQNAMDILHAIKLYYVGTEQEANIARVRRLESDIFSNFILAHLLLYIRIFADLCFDFYWKRNH